jgi:hypothetical protein
MLTVIILDNGEPNVIQMTFENLWRELKDIPDSDLLIEENWFDGLKRNKNKYVCFVEPDCLVNSGYFLSQVSLLQKDPYFRKLAMLSGVTGVTNWANRFFGYRLDTLNNNRVTPNHVKVSNAVYPVQIGYVPGSIIRVAMLKKLLEVGTVPGVANIGTDLTKLSMVMSLGFWRQGDGNRVHINPNATYVTTEKYVNELCDAPDDVADLLKKFESESI